jgi:NitT/TauT family transport system substrate-binding protein
VRSSVRLAFLLILQACTSEAPARRVEQEATRLRVGYQRYLTYAPIFIAQAEGFFAEHGVDVEMVPLQDGNAGTAVIVSGDLDVLAGPGSPGLLNAIAGGSPARLVADKGSIPDSGCSPLALIGRPGIDLAARSGAGRVRRISPSRATQAFEYFVERALGAAGADTTGVEIMHLPPAILGDALARGRVDVVSTTEPNVTRLVEAGNRVLVDASSVVPGLPYGFIVFGERLTRRERDVGERFMLAYLEGMRQYEEGKTPRNLEIVAAATGDDPALLARACWAPFRLAEIDSMAFADLQRWAVGRRLMDRTLGMREYWDDEFLRRAILELRRHPVHGAASANR